MLPTALFRETVTITRETVGGFGPSAGTETENIPAIIRRRIITTPQSDGRETRKQLNLTFRTNVSVHEGDTITTPNESAIVYEVATIVGPTGKPHHIEAVCW